MASRGSRNFGSSPWQRGTGVLQRDPCGLEKDTGLEMLLVLQIQARSAQKRNGPMWTLGAELAGYSSSLMHSHLREPLLNTEAEVLRSVA